MTCMLNYPASDLLGGAAECLPIMGCAKRRADTQHDNSFLHEIIVTRRSAGKPVWGETTRIL